MAAGRWKLYDTAKQKIGQGIIDLDSHTFKMALFSSSSNCNTLTHDELSDLTSQLSTGDGYTSGGETLTGVTWSNILGGNIQFTANPVTWNASGLGLLFRFAVIYDDTASGDPLLCVCLLDTTPANISVLAGGSVQITMDASGIFTLGGATSD